MTITQILDQAMTLNVQERKELAKLLSDTPRTPKTGAEIVAMLQTMDRVMKPKEWGAFTLLAPVWGTFFLWIKIALVEIGSFLLVSIAYPK